MTTRIGFRLVLLIALGLLFTIPFLFLGFVSMERRQYRDQAVAEVARSTAGSQRIAGPFLIVPYRTRILSEEVGPAGRGKVVHERIEDDELVLLPESLAITSRFAMEERHRGIFPVRLYRGDVRLTGAFALPEKPEGVRGEWVAWGTPYLSVGVSDPRGMREVPEVEVAGKPHVSEPGTGTAWLGSGLQARVPEATPDGVARSVPFAFDVALMGTQSFDVVPVGRSTTVQLSSPWPHPSFSGRFLPDSRTVRADGFDARWQMSRFATDIEDLLRKPEEQRANELAQMAFGVEFIDPVDAYRLTDRALKYGMLFVLLTFTAFFLFEVLGGVVLHPVQYGLVGAALTMFFLLLLSLSEHLPYVIAYVSASLACIGLMTFYLVHALKGWSRALGFAAGLALLYALLYVVMQSQDYALLLGSALLFSVLAFVMLSTRRLDWTQGPASPKRG